MVVRAVEVSFGGDGRSVPICDRADRSEVVPVDIDTEILIQLSLTLYV
jgi:hypothetical protein